MISPTEGHIDTSMGTSVNKPAMRSEDGVDFPMEAYAYTPDHLQPDTWKIRMWESPDAKATVKQLGVAAGTISRGTGIPTNDLPHVKAKLRAEYSALGAAIPSTMHLSDGPRFRVDLSMVTFSEGELPTRIPLAMIGTFYKGKQKFTVSRSDVRTMAENFSKSGTGNVVMDYEHASEFPEMAQGQPVPAAGWVTGIDPAPDADGIVWGTVNFTSRARGMIAAQEYKYISPVINWGVRDKSTGDPQGATLTSCALTNRPVLEQMPAIQLSDAGWTASADEEFPNLDQLEPEEQESMAKKDNMEVCASCGAPTKDGKFSADDVMAASDVQRDGTGLVLVASLRKGALVPVSVVLEIEAQRVAMNEVSVAVAAGKITPAQKPHFEKIALSDIGTFRSLVATMGQQVDLSEHGLAGNGAEGGAKEELGKIDAQMDRRAREIMKDQGRQYHEALKLVASESPELDRRRTLLSRRLAGRGGEE